MQGMGIKKRPLIPVEPEDEIVSQLVPTTGRPTTYSPELADLICDRIVQGDSLRAISADEGFPCVATVFNWLRRHKEFLEQYARAKEEQADAFAEEILDIADDGSNDWMEKTHGDKK